MSTQIESDKLFIQEIFDKRFYRIPEYQRPYVWEDDQVIELLTDIVDAYSANYSAEYFLGSLVLRKNEKNQSKVEFTEYDVLDGQQRLTTLFLIHAVIRDTVTDASQKRYQTTSEAIYVQEDIDNNQPERMRVVFDIRDDVKNFVYNHIKQWKSTLDKTVFERFVNEKNGDISVKNMSKAILTIKEFFNNGVSIDDFYKYLRTRVLLIYVASEDLEDAFHLFTVMNNRGMKLRNSDILKADNLKEVPEADRIILGKSWEKIEEYFGEDFDNFLSHLRTILVKNKASYNLLKEYEENIYKPRTYNRTTKEYKFTTPLLKKGKDTFDFIEKYFKHYKDLFDVDSDILKNNLPLKNKLHLMKTGFEADFWVPPVLAFYNKYSTTSLLDFVNSLDNKFSADWITSQTFTTRLENMNKLIKVIEDASSPNDILNDSLLKYNSQDFIRILNQTIYGKKHAKYLLLKLDHILHGDTTDFNPPQQISVEHILPQNPSKSSKWVKDFNENQRETWTDKIGNLVLISRRKNSSLSNQDFDSKKDRYFKGNIELFSNSIRIWKNHSSWKMNDLKSNHKTVLSELFTNYKINITKEELDKLVS